MRKKLEVFQSILLVFLIALSLLLTLAIWNYQPNYEIAEDGTTTESKLSGEEETKRDLIKPAHIIFKEEDQYLGLSKKEEEAELYKNILDVSLYNFEIVEETEPSYFEGTRSVELVFPTSIPTNALYEMFKIDDRTIFESYFNRIYISLDREKARQQVVFKNQDADGTDLTATVQNFAQLIDLMDEQQIFEDLITYRKVNLYNEREVYIPEEPNLIGRIFRYTTVNPESVTLQTILFQNPSAIISEPNPDGGRIYTDGNREVVVQGYQMDFTNFTVASSSDQQTQRNSPQGQGELGNQLLNQTINYVNSHNGWPVDQDVTFRLEELNVSTKQTDYRMTYENYPVFSDVGLDQISVNMLEQSVYQYSRPLMKLTFSYDRRPTNLMSAEDLLGYLEESDKYELDQILDISVGYRLEELVGEQYFDLIPTWNVETFTGWEQIDPNAKPENQGGNASNAMEPN
ncbi:YycH family regulatory protein [Saliterribacillus persicus]|uniref:Regulatory protein YycH of two-component signal transduction system YycFG n=1 Tax=Saliterribacillus persicus TaxID=930114 RepID=A0A368X9K1_9BACI|nr:two-component system activity regulator YycH [Saliterribacillus persicus]RCW64525.1 regulatory protein YycH of two-component signal transduction system YycFG [Saliterribacillus persicus]